MFFVLEDHNKNQYVKLYRRMFQLRKEVFAEQLEWDVKSSNLGEIDEYDDCNPAYLVWSNAEKTTLYGCLRLLPTTGPTLLYDVFRDTFSNNVSLTAPGIWEGTRLCIDEKALSRDHPKINSKRGFCLMLLGLCEVALQFKIHTLISNYEPATKRLYSMSGAVLNELGRADTYGKRPVCAGSFEVSAKVLCNMRIRLGIRQALLNNAFPSEVDDKSEHEAA